jgi:RNA polymerase sigma-32 factor
MSLPVLTDSIQSYMTEVNRYPVLSQDDEFEVAERYLKHKSLEDAHTLVTSNLRYVVKIAFEFRNYGCRLADLIQEGNIGLMVAVKKFDPYKGFRLITYATWWIKSFMQEFILKTRGMVRRGSKALKRKLFYRNEAPLGDDAALEMNAVTEDSDNYYDLSLNSPVADEGPSHLDMLPDMASGPFETVETRQECALVKKEVSSALSLLNDKERLIVEKRLMAEEPASLQSIGERLGLTRERVRQIESSAMKKLQKTLSGRLVTA